MSTVSDYFGCMVFDDRVMKANLSADVYASLRRTIDEGAKLDASVANAVAAAMKDWAVAHGATHYTHWFQPLTGITAEKHDSFISPAPDGGVIMDFSGKELIKGEPDASSFPSGGLRATFEARGYTAWDPTSYAFIKGKTLCIPTAFCSYGGEALDKKTPLLRSMEALNRQALRILKLFGNTDVKCVRTNVGHEQEYFLVDKEMYEQRKDLIFTGRTLFGAKSPKGQEMDDHYFGVIKPRVAAYMEDLNEELWKLGILAKTEHNEVAPAQHELAPIYTTTNIATDHNQLTMEIMQKVAAKHGLVCLLHEKPFAGINGSGKHNNWSLATDTGILLHAPGKTQMDNLRFVTFIVETLMAVYRHNGLLKASIISATNAHRLGANEAPPAIISSFLGKQLTELLQKLEQTDDDELFNLAGKQALSLDIPQIPELMLDNTDRNRTSPFAFTGNRFEFRAVGSQANCAAAMIVLNTAVAETLTDFKARVDALIAAGTEPTKAIVKVLRQDLKICKPIHFEGNGYSDEWKKEAAKRGLDVESSAPLMLDNYVSPESIKMFESMHVLSKTELEARLEIKQETYTKKIQIEARIFGDLCLNHIIPVATRYQSQLIDNVHKVKEIFPPAIAEKVSANNMVLIQKISEHSSFITENVEKLVNARKVANKLTSERDKAIAYHDTVACLLESIRYHVDKLELIVDDELWPLPKYREMLFIR